MNILIVDDHPLVHRGIAAILSLEKDIKIVGLASNLEEATDLINKEHPDIILVDLKLGSQSGLDIIRYCKKRNLDCKSVLLTSSIDPDDFSNAQKLGIEGYISKRALPEEFLSAIRLISRGRKYFDSGLLDLIIRKDEDNLTQLTRREKEVLIALGQGLNNKEIAKKLYITEHTVKKHVTQVLAKLELTGRTQAAIYVHKNGLLTEN